MDYRTSDRLKSAIPRSLFDCPQQTWTDLSYPFLL